MATTQPTPLAATQASYWQTPASGPDQVLPKLRGHVGAPVAALVVQATIALLGVLPGLPGGAEVADPYGYAERPVNFWIQFAAIELMAAAVLAFAFGSVVRLGGMPLIGRLVLGLAFAVIPAAAILYAAVGAAASAGGSGAAASIWLANAFFAAVFFGLPLVVLASGAPDRGDA